MLKQIPSAFYGCIYYSERTVPFYSYPGDRLLHTVRVCSENEDADGVNEVLTDNEMYKT
jgi:hypothetical protein